MHGYNAHQGEEQHTFICINLRLNNLLLHITENYINHEPSVSEIVPRDENLVVATYLFAVSSEFPTTDSLEHTEFHDGL